MSTLEDKILGEKLQYYCSDSEEEKEASGDEDADEDSGNAGAVAAAPQPAPDMTQDMTHWQGNSANTGPKGRDNCFALFNKINFDPL